MSNTYLTKTNSGTGSETKGTFSAWIKISNFGDDNTIFREYESSGNYISIKLKSGAIQVYGQNNSSAFVNVKTERLLRDFSGWYHAVVAIDSTQSTAADRVKIYINGVQETSLASTTYPSSSLNCKINQNNEVQTIGGAGSSEYFDGSLSHVHWVDGTALAPTVFGETDTTTGQWKIKADPSFTPGTNGFTILKDGNTITDQSANSNNFALAGGTLTKTEDCPSNVFATLNPLDRWLSATLDLSSVLSNGNNTFHTSSDSQKAIARTTLGMSKGKYYCEVKIPQIERTWIGINNSNFYTVSTNNFWTTNLESGFFWYGNGTAIYNSNDDSYNTYGAYANNDIVMMALDMDNYAFYLGKNGSWLNSGNPESGSSKTGSVTGLTNFGTNPLTNHGEVFFMIGDSSTAGTAHTQWNFGNGFFGTTAVATNSGNGYAGAEGSSIFNYQPPTGYSALSTKGLNQ